VNYREYIHHECVRQHVGLAEEQGMLSAAMALGLLPDMLDVTVGTLTEPLVLEVAAMVEPRNAGGYRRVPVTFDQGVPAIAAELVPRQMERLIENAGSLHEIEFCKAFLDIHPFEDGNGRVASLIYNWMRGVGRRDGLEFEPLPYFYGGE
jgi:hypothetical protein